MSLNDGLCWGFVSQPLSSTSWFGPLFYHNNRKQTNRAFIKVLRLPQNQEDTYCFKKILLCVFNCGLSSQKHVLGFSDPKQLFGFSMSFVFFSILNDYLFVFFPPSFLKPNFPLPPLFPVPQLILHCIHSSSTVSILIQSGIP